MRDKKSPTSPEETATISNNVAIDRGTTLHSRTTIREPVIIGDHCEIGPNAYIGPYTSIGDRSTITNSEIQNTIVMENASIECDDLITDSIIGRNVTITRNNQPPKGKRFIIGDQSKVTI